MTQAPDLNYRGVCSIVALRLQSSTEENELEYLNKNDLEQQAGLPASSYDTSDSSSKGIVSSLTSIVNFVMGGSGNSTKGGCLLD